MTTQDLSLLTDEEVRQEAEDIAVQIDAAPVEDRIRALANAFIAARAENKRKDEMLRDVDAHLDGLSHLGIREWLGETAYKDAHAAIHMRIRAALLQSEKGGE